MKLKIGEGRRATIVYSPKVDFRRRAGIFKFLKISTIFDALQNFIFSVELVIIQAFER